MSTFQRGPGGEETPMTRRSLAAIALFLALPAEMPAHAAYSDFDGDGRSDVFWRNGGTGESYVYPMDGTAILGTEGYARTVADQNWRIEGIGDFDGDGRSDVLWRNSSTGENYVYLMSGKDIAGEGCLRTVADPNWKVAGVGDFDGDGKDDILWRNSATGENYVYPMDGLAIKASEGYLRRVANQNWQVAGVGDFDGDLKADILWRNVATGENYLYPMDGLAILGTEGYARTVADQNWHVAGTGDFDDDGNADILWRNAATGENYVYLLDGTAIAGEGYIRTVADQGWQVAGVGDFGGDGKADVLWRHRETGENYLYPMDGTTILGAEGYLRTVADLNWQVATVADIDGDGRADILWRNWSSGENYLYPMTGTTIGAGEGYVRAVADLNWHPVSQASALSAPLAGARRTFTQFGQTVTTQGDNLSSSHLIGSYDADFLGDGVDATIDAGMFANDVRGLVLDSWIPARVVRFDPAGGTLEVREIVTESFGGETFQDEAGTSLRRQSDGSWKLWGNRRLADLTVHTITQTSNYGIPIGPSQMTFVGANAPVDLLAGVTVTGGGVFSGTPVDKAPGPNVELIQADPEPAAPVEYFFDRFTVNMQTALSAATEFTLEVTPASGPAQAYAVLSNASTDQYVTITNLSGHTLVDANPGGVLLVEWSMSSPGFDIEHIRLTGIVHNALGASCQIIGGDLPPTATSSGISLPATCNGEPVSQAAVYVWVEGVNGEQTQYEHGFLDPPD
jgi:hypothetical protein